MPAPEEFTGERFLPECTGEIWAEHWHRYLFAAQHVAGLEVLDIASGEGYGSWLLGKHAKSVVGVDIDAQTVANANARYGNARVRFETGSVAAIPFPDASFDCVVSFETLEHVTEHEEMLAELRRVLRPSGFVIISTPNRVEYSDKRDFRNEFHVRELDGPEFRALLNRYFGAQRWYGQRLLFNSGLWPIDEPGRDKAAIRAEWVSVDDIDRPLPDPMYFVAFAAADVQRLPSSSRVATLLGDPDDTIYREYESTVARTRSLEQHLADRERIVVERDAQIRAIDAQKREAEALIAERDAEVAALDRQKRQAEALIAAREAVVIERDRQLDAVNARLREAEKLIADRERVVVERDQQIGLLDGQKRLAESLLADRERVIVERDAQLDALNARSDNAERLLADRERIIVERDGQIAALDQQKRAAEALVADRERIIVERDAQVAALDLQKRAIEALVAERERIIVERDQQVEALLGRVTHAESLVSERDRLLAATNDRMSEAEQVIAERDRTLADREQQLAIALQRATGLEALAVVRSQRIDTLEHANNQLQVEVSRRASWRWWLALPVRRLRDTVPQVGGTDSDR